MRASIACLAVLLAGCATIHPAKMVPNEASYGTHYDRTVALNVGGGSGAVRWYGETISPEDFEEGLRQAVERASLFRQILEAQAADYILSVNLKFAGSHPGLTLHAWVIAKWSLVERETGREVWASEIKCR